MVALTTLNLPTEAWKSARLLRAVPNCRLVLMMSYHMLSPALSVEETIYKPRRKLARQLFKSQRGSVPEED